MSLIMDGGQLELIRQHGRADYPNECCGLLIGKIEGDDRRVVELLPIRNSREDSRRNRYLISPRELLEAEKNVRKRGLDMLGIYHSHPDHPARPSEYDREHALPWFSYIIVAIHNGEAGDLASWRLREDRSGFDEETMVVEPVVIPAKLPGREDAKRL